LQAKTKAKVRVFGPYRLLVRLALKESQLNARARPPRFAGRYSAKKPARLAASLATPKTTASPFTFICQAEGMRTAAPSPYFLLLLCKIRKRASSSRQHRYDRLGAALFRFGPENSYEFIHPSERGCTPLTLFGRAIFYGARQSDR